MPSLAGHRALARPKISPACDVIAGVKVTRMAHTRPGLSERPRRGFEADEDAPFDEVAGDQSDLYGMLGYRREAQSSLTTQQWLVFRQIEL